MTGVLKDFSFIIAYLDDIIIFSKMAEEHLDHIRQVFKTLWDTHLSVKLSKCHFFAKEIKYLGHILSTTGIIFIFPIAFLSQTFTETQRKWSTPEQETYGLYYAITKCNYYLQGADIIVSNDHKPLAKFVTGKNANNKVNRWDWSS